MREASKRTQASSLEDPAVLDLVRAFWGSRSPENGQLLLHMCAHAGQSLEDRRNLVASHLTRASRLILSQLQIFRCSHSRLLG